MTDKVPLPPLPEPAPGNAGRYVGGDMHAYARTYAAACVRDALERAGQGYEDVYAETGSRGDRKPLYRTARILEGEAVSELPKPVAYIDGESLTYGAWHPSMTDAEMLAAGWAPLFTAEQVAKLMDAHMAWISANTGTMVCNDYESPRVAFRAAYCKEKQDAGSGD